MSADDLAEVDEGQQTSTMEVAEMKTLAAVEKNFIGTV